MTTLTIILGATAAGILGLIGLFALAMRRRWFSKFQNGFVITLMIALGGTGLATAAAVGLWGYEAAQRIVFQQLVDGMSNIGGVVESQLDRDIRNTAKRLDRLTAGDLAHAAIANPGETRAELAELQQFNHRLLQIAVTDADGRSILQTSRTDKSEPVDPTAMHYALRRQAIHLPAVPLGGVRPICHQPDLAGDGSGRAANRSGIAPLRSASRGGGHDRPCHIRAERPGHPCR